ARRFRLLFSRFRERDSSGDRERDRTRVGDFSDASPILALRNPASGRARLKVSGESSPCSVGRALGDVIWSPDRFQPVGRPTSRSAQGRCRNRVIETERFIHDAHARETECTDNSTGSDST
ncbi:hypothetical protein HPB47_001367, partial [Ixodes persulcatus]